MKKLFLALGVIFLASCSVPTSNKNTGSAAIGSYKIVVIDNCQYIYQENFSDYGPTFTHKGDCNNPIHLYKAQVNDSSLSNNR